jgi:addiction module RelE/StbE family toxin
MINKFHIEYLPTAEKDLIDIFEYILSDNPSAATNFLDKIDESILKLEDFPYIGVVPDDSRLKYLGYRILIVENYLVFYVVYEDEDLVEIRRILHGKRQYDFLF